MNDLSLFSALDNFGADIITDLVKITKWLKTCPIGADVIEMGYQEWALQEKICPEANLTLFQLCSCPTVDDYNMLAHLTFAYLDEPAAREWLEKLLGTTMDEATDEDKIRIFALEALRRNEPRSSDRYDMDKPLEERRTLGLQYVKYNVYAESHCRACSNFNGKVMRIEDAIEFENKYSHGCGHRWIGMEKPNCATPVLSLEEIAQAGSPWLDLVTIE